MKRLISLLIILNIVSCLPKQNKPTTFPERPKTPIMGWASWNSYRVNINEGIIKAQTDAMASNGMKDAGYKYINMDDGFFGGRDEKGNLLTHPTRFPNGMKALADYIHAKGLKAGIYSDAGLNSCASYWDKDTIGVGIGLYGHEDKDLNLFLKEWGYDFLKVDWCGGQWLGLDEQVRYSEIGAKVRKIRPDVVYNVCRWQFPGEWVVNVADSWRISGDIHNSFHSIMGIVDKNADLWRYAGPGHVNDMDMLMVGAPGLSYEENKSHFSMWCMMCSPLMAGNDLTTMNDEVLEILTNKEMIAINQDPLVYQARRLVDKGDLEIWAKPLVSTVGGQVAVALLNRGETEETIEFSLKEVSLDASKGYSMRNVWEEKDYPKSTDETQSFKVPAHGTVVLKLDGISLPFNVFQIVKEN